jgi:sporulation integral membrane protein YtvI
MNLKTIIGIALGLLLLYGVFTVGSPFLLAVVIAIFLEPLVRLLMRALKINRIAAAIAVCTAFTLSLLFLTYLLGVKVYTEVEAFAKKAPGFLEEFNEYFKNTVGRTEGLYASLPEDTVNQLKDWTTNGIASLTDILSGLFGGLSGYLLNAAKALPEMFIWFIVFLVALFLFSMNMSGLRAGFLAFFEEKSRSKVSAVLDDLRKAIFGFLQSQIILCAIVYVMSLTGFLILGVNYPLAVALLVVIVDIMPIVGVGSALVPWAVYNFATGNMFLGVGLIIMFVVITIVRRTVEPKVLGDAVGIGSLSALISLYVGFKLVGVVGLLLGPLVVIIYQAMRKAGLLNIKIKLE